MLDDHPCELPKVDERFYGHGQRWGYLIGGDAKGTGMRMHSLVVRDRATGNGSGTGCATSARRW